MFGSIITHTRSGSAQGTVLAGLRRLEYRGCDSVKTVTVQ
jgi:glucosamine 6-phosphate synthetase-like amidotransferase/phosphosugar isomerase protein